MKNPKIIRDYFIEFHEILETAITEDIKNLGQRFTNLGRYDLSRPFLNYLWYRRLHYRDTYNILRSNGFSPKAAIKNVRLNKKIKNHNVCAGPNVIPLECHPWRETLLPFEGFPVFFCVGQRNLEYLRPVIMSFHEKAVVWTDADCNNEPWVCDNKFVLPYTLSKFSCFANNLMEANVPDFHVFASTIFTTLNLLKPSKLICNDGCQTQYMIAAEYCRDANIPSICIQQGWPSFLHQGFRNWPYSDFISWGSGFSSLLKMKNRKTNFIAGGYPYEINSMPLDLRFGIGFFLQDKILLASERTIEIMSQAIHLSAMMYPDAIIYVRRHPLCRMNDDTQFTNLPNVVNADEMPLAVLYSKCKVAVSHFSSCIMESAIHLCVPIVLDPTWDSHYCPDIETEDIGFVCSDIESFKHILPMAFQKKQDEINKKWCEQKNKKALQNICSIISNIN